MYFDGEIPDYRLIGTLNPDKTPETPDLSGLTRLDCIKIPITIKILKTRYINI